MLNCGILEDETVHLSLTAFGNYFGEVGVFWRSELDVELLNAGK